MPGDNDAALDTAARTLTAARYAIALVGAGISVQSGIRPFRGAGGLWTEKGEPPMDGYQRFMRDPASAWKDMLARRGSDDEFSRSLAASRPNDGHRALAELEQLGVLKHTITQNIDNLHFAAGSAAVTEIHGNRTRLRCIDCGARWPWDEFLALAAASTSHSTDRSETSVVEIEGVAMRVPPECPQCAGIVKSDTVMFGEPIPRQFLQECDRQAGLADCILVAGTSATVYPAAGYAESVLMNGGALIEVNIDETPFTRYATAVLRGPSAELLQRLVARVRDLI